MKWMIQGAATIAGESRSGASTVDIIINKDKIERVGADLNPNEYQIDKVIRADDKLIVPGFINSHIHSHDRFDKGRFDTLPLEIWMGLYNPPTLGRKWTPRDCYLRTMISGFENIRCGTTMVLDDLHAGFPLPHDCIEAVFQAYQDLGIRAQVSVAYSDKPYFETIPELQNIVPEELKIKSKIPAAQRWEMVFEFWESFAKKWLDRVQMTLSVSGMQRCSDEFARAAWKLSEKLNLPITVHVLETKIQELSGAYYYGKSIVEHMDDIGCLTPLTTLSHCVWVNDTDIDLIAKRGASVVHNPLSNLKLGSGIAPVRKMLDKGIDVGIGTDNHNASDTANIIEAMKMVSLMHRVRAFDYRQWVRAEEIMNMATKGGAACAKKKDVGTIEPGQKADLVLIDLNRNSFFPQNNLLNQLILSENGDGIDSVIVDGQMIFDNGSFTRVDENKIWNEVKERSEVIRDIIESGVEAANELSPYLEKSYFLNMNKAE